MFNITASIIQQRSKKKKKRLILHRAALMKQPNLCLAFLSRFLFHRDSPSLTLLGCIFPVFKEITIFCSRKLALFKYLSYGSLQPFSVQAATTKHHGWGLRWQTFISHHSEPGKPKIKVSADLVSGEGPLLVCWEPPSCGFSHCKESKH